MAKYITVEKIRARLRHTVVCSKMMGRANNERIAQNKRARAGSLTIVD